MGPLRTLHRPARSTRSSLAGSPLHWIGRWLCVAAALTSSVVGAPAVHGAGAVPTFDHIFVIVMENRSLAQVIGNPDRAPYLNQLASQYGLAANYVAVAHPSLPNYLALTGGDTFGITTDCTDCGVSAPNLVADRIAPSGRTWKAYMEGMPSPCFMGDSHRYVQKHDPFVYYDDISSGPQCGNVVSMDGLAADLASTDTTPDFVWITPDECDDMHDCSTKTGDTWLQENVPPILSSPAFANQNSLLVITWDEDNGTVSNQVPTLLVSSQVEPGFRSTAPYTHYSLLRTIEDAWSLAPLGPNDASASPLSDFFPATAADPAD